MKRLIYTVAVCCVSTLLYAQSTFDYSSIEGTKDSVLKSSLSQLIQVQQYLKYGSRSAWNQDENKLRTWDGFFQSDRHSDGTIWDMYSTQVHYFPADDIGSLSAASLAIEHSMPKSWWGWSDKVTQSDLSQRAYQDLYHLCPAEHNANTAKSNYGPNEIDSLVTFENDIFKVGYHTGYPITRFFEPCDDYKGDFARAYFYMATCYENLHWIDTAVYTVKSGVEVMSPNTSSAYFCMDNTDYKEFQPWLTELLLQWHRSDPVSQKELDRQVAIEKIQGNRNPFIDYPELVEYIWGDKQNTEVCLEDLVYSYSDEYVVEPDRQNIVIFDATDITDSTFLLSWRDAGAESYLLDVYTKTVLSTEDTVLAVPYLNKSVITSNPMLSGSDSGLSSDGSCAIQMGTASADYTLTITITNPLNRDLRLRLRASISKYDKEANLLVKADNNLVADLSLDHNETYYEVNIPAQTREVQLMQGESGKRISLQQLFLIDGQAAYQLNSLTGFPLTTTLLSETVQPDVEVNNPVTLYFSVTPNELKTSEEKSVVFTRVKQQDPEEKDDEEPAGLSGRKGKRFSYIINGNQLQVSALANTDKINLYAANGNVVYVFTEENDFITLPQGVYILRAASSKQSVKIVM